MSGPWWCGNRGRGSNWIRRRKRHLIYERDGLKCLWCTETVIHNETATLDHFVCREDNGSNAASNLFTCCYACNSSRGSLPAKQYALTLEDGAKALQRIRRQLAISILYREPAPTNYRWRHPMPEAAE